MESIAIIGPAPRRLIAAQKPDTPTAAELSARAQRVIDDIDQAVGRQTVCACVVCDAGLPYPAVTCPPLHPRRRPRTPLPSARRRHRPAPQLPIVEIAPGGGILAVR